MITVAGEALIDVLVDQSGSVAAFVGGGPFNVARTVARLGGRVQFLGRLSDDAFGRRLDAALRERGVELPVRSTTPAPSTLALAELDPAGVADYRFYVDGTSAPQLRGEDLAPDVLAGSAAIAVGGLGLVLEPMASTMGSLLATATREATVLLDANCRERAIGDLAAYRATFDGFLARVDIVKVSTDDLRLLAPGAEIRTAARALLDGHPSAVIVTDGGAPVVIHTAAHERSIPVPLVPVVDTVGAGDAFVAGLLTWWTDHRLRRDRVADLDTLLAGTEVAVEVAGAACTVAGANLPETFLWERAGQVSDPAG